MGNDPTNAIDPTGLTTFMFPIKPTFYVEKIGEGFSAHLEISPADQERGKLIQDRVLQACKKLETSYLTLTNYYEEYASSPNWRSNPKHDVVKGNRTFYQRSMKKALDYVKNPSNRVDINLVSLWTQESAPVWLRRAVGGKTRGYVYPWYVTGYFSLTDYWFEASEEDQVETIIHELFARSINDIDSNDYELLSTRNPTIFDDLVNTLSNSVHVNSLKAIHEEREATDINEVFDRIRHPGENTEQRDLRRWMERITKDMPPPDPGRFGPIDY